MMADFSGLAVSEIKLKTSLGNLVFHSHHFHSFLLTTEVSPNLMLKGSTRWCELMESLLEMLKIIQGEGGNLNVEQQFSSMPYNCLLLECIPCRKMKGLDTYKFKNPLGPNRTFLWVTDEVLFDELNYTQFSSQQFVLCSCFASEKVMFSQIDLLIL